MKKKITGSVLSAGAIVLGLAAAGCGGAIETAADGWAMLGYTLLAIVLGCAALALAGLGLVVEQRKEPQKIHELTAMIKGVVRPGRRKMTTDEAKLWTEVSRINTRLKDEMVNAGFAVRALPGDLQEDAINVLSRTVSGMLGDLTAMMAETGEP